MGGAPFWVNQAGTKPISGLPTAPGTPNWGSKWKADVAENYTHHLSMDVHGAHQSLAVNYLIWTRRTNRSIASLSCGMTFDWQDNDIKMNQFMFKKLEIIARALHPKFISRRTFQSRHIPDDDLNGGAVVGTDPEYQAPSTLSAELGCAAMFRSRRIRFPQGLGYNPAGLVAALTSLVRQSHSRKLSQKARTVGVRSNHEKTTYRSDVGCFCRGRNGAGSHKRS